MNRFAALLDRLAYEPRRNAKLRLLVDYFSHTPDPDRGYALAAMTGALMFKEAKPGLIRGLVEERTDPVLFRMSYHYVGDLAETVALIWPAPGHESVAPASPDAPAIGHNNPPPHIPTLTEVVETLATAGKSDLPARVAGWFDALDETGRWALLKLITRELRVGVSARLAKTAVAQLGGVEPDEVELIWHGLEPPYEDLFAWVEGRGPKPESGNPAPFRPPMLSHPLEDEDFEKLDATDFQAEWKWDGIRLQAVAGRAGDGLQADAVPFPLGHELGRVELFEVLLLEGVGEHGGTVGSRIARLRPGRAALDPGEQLFVGRSEPVPDVLDLVGRDVAEARHGGLGEPGRDADAQLPGDQLEERPAPGLVEAAEPVGDEPGQLNLARRRQPLDHLGEGGDRGRRVVVAEAGLSRRGAFRPHQRDGLGEVADVVPGQAEQHRIGALGDEAADEPRLGVRERQRPRHGGEGPAALRVGRVAEVVGHEADLGIAPGLVGEPVEERGEAVHAALSAGASPASSSSP